MKKKYIIGIILLVIVCLVFNGIKQKDSKNKYVTKNLKRCTIEQIVEATGTINPVNTVSVGSTVSGLIKAIYVDFNSEVKKGQVLAQIDPTTFEANVQQNLATINNSKANLMKLQAEQDMREKTYKRYKNLYARNFIAKSELDQAESDYKANLAQINSAKAQIAQATAQYKVALANLSYTKILAPVDGTIISRKIDVGQPVAASFQAPEHFTIAQDLKKMQIEVSVSEADIGKVKVDQDVLYTLDGYPEEQFRGKVTQVRISPTTVSNVVTYSVIVDVENNELKLKPGMTANVSIVVHQSKDVLCVPNSALKITMDDNTKKYEHRGVWTTKNKKPERIDIEIGASSEISTEIITDKLKEGDPVIVEVLQKKGKPKNTTMRRPPMM